MYKTGASIEKGSKEQWDDLKRQEICKYKFAIFIEISKNPRYVAGVYES